MKAVLLIDDEPQMAPLVEMILANGGVRVVAASTWDEAVERTRETRPDVVLLDLALGEEDGLELLPRLRGHRNLKDVPIIVFSVHDSKRGQAMKLGAAGFVAKPFRSAELVEALAPHLDRR